MEGWRHLKNYLQKKQGIENSPELFYKDMLKAGPGFSHPHPAKMVAAKATEAIDWTRNTMGMKISGSIRPFRRAFHGPMPHYK